MQIVHIDVKSHGEDVMPNGVLTDFSLKYNVSIDLNEEINVEAYVEAIANAIESIAILFAKNDCIPQKKN